LIAAIYSFCAGSFQACLIVLGCEWKALLVKLFSSLERSKCAMRKFTQLFKFFSKILFVALSLATICNVAAFAQSIEPNFPTPLSANEISGSIAARDVGDARLTRYFYILSATPGDLLITVESNNLNGDVDLFTAGTLRPLAKVSMYAAESGTKATKSIFLKQRQQIILRIEARSANDNEGTYRIRFEGSFEPLPDSASASDNASAPRAPEVASTRSGTRVSATGARLPEEVKEARSEPQPAQPEPSGACHNCASQHIHAEKIAASRSARNDRAQQKTACKTIYSKQLNS